MKNQRFLFLVLFLLVFMIGISAAGAADASASDIISTDDDGLILDESINDDALDDYDEELVSTSANENPALNEEGTTGSFQALNEAINGNTDDVIELNCNYKYQSGDDNYIHGIKIIRPVTIKGNGYTIDGSNIARIFHISGNNVVIENITFKNGNATGDEIYDTIGGAIYWWGDNGKVTYSNFTSNTADYEGGAIYWQGDNGKVTYSNFTSNHADDNGGAIDWYGDGGEVTYSNFTSNTAKAYGGAIYWVGLDSEVTYSSFTSNHAKFGGAIEWNMHNGKVTYSSFTSNTAEYWGGAICWSGDDGEVAYSSFISNTAPKGGAITLWYITGQKINNNIFLKNTNTIYIQSSSDYNFDYNWFGNNASSYSEQPYGFCNYWLFLNATADPNPMDLSGPSNVTFKLWLYDPTDGVSEYDNSPLPTISMELSSTNGALDKTIAGLGESIEYTANALGTGSITATIENVEQRIRITTQTETSFDASDVTATYNVGKYFVITLKDSKGNGIAGAKITVSLDGSKEYTTDKNGQVKIDVSGLAPKSYTAEISFAGNETHLASQTTATVTVKKATPTITAKAKTYKFEDKTKKYTITLKDNKGKVMKNTKVTLKVNGKTYTATTDSKGVATFKLSKLTKKGTYNAVITYAGDKYYNKVTKKAKITVKAPAKKKTTWKTVAKGSKDKAMVKKIQKALKNNGYYLSYKGRYLKVDGVFQKYTEMAVKQFQKDKGLKVTGKVDEKTAKKLKLI